MKIEDYLYEGIKKKLTDDIIIAYEVFKLEDHENLEGVILSLNSFEGFGSYLKSNPSKLSDFVHHLYSNIDFIVHLVFAKEGNEEFYPLLEK